MYTISHRNPSMAGAHGKARKNYRLTQSKLDVAQRVLGTRTETETIEQALDLVAFGERLARRTERGRDRVAHVEHEAAHPAPAR
ncbi:MAG TPA: hypothetical protein VLH75_08270 [Longimicrobiales bacterium]|nr:hypothetical protein [Longimicrobiales bacterium]